MDLALFFRTVYDRFNARDVDALLVDMTPDVDWPDVRRGRRLRGHDAVRAYWADQWQVIDPQVEARRVTELPDGRFDVEVRQVVRDLATGDVLVDQVIHHVYELRGGAVATMHVTSTPPPCRPRHDESAA